MKHLILLITAALLLTACAKKPEKIQAAYVNANPYRQMSCGDLARAETETSALLEKVSQQQRNARHADIAGVLLLGIPAASLVGSDQEETVAKLKGTLIAIDESQSANSC